MYIDPEKVEKLRKKYHSKDRKGKAAFLAQLNPETYFYLKYYTNFLLRDNQIVNNNKYFNIFMTGRGYGKNFLASHWIRDAVYKLGGTEAQKIDKERKAEILLVAATYKDMDDNMKKDIAAAFAPHQKPIITEKEITCFNGVKISIGTSEQEIRGGNIKYAWFDEVGKWCQEIEDKVHTKFLNIIAAIRIGKPKVLVTTNPKPWQLMKEWYDKSEAGHKQYNFVTGTMYDNKENLSKEWLELMEEITPERHKRQELLGELLFDTPGAVWNIEEIEKVRIDPKVFYEKYKRGEINLIKTVIAVDPAVSSGEKSCENGIIIISRDQNGYLYVLEDCSMVGDAFEWSKLVAKKFNEYEANLVVAEKNQGGNLLELALKTADKYMPIKLIHAVKTKGSGNAKVNRAADLGKVFYVRNEIFHVGKFDKLEKQMCSYNGDPKSIKESDRMDALVYGIQHCRAEPNYDFRRDISNLGRY